MDTQLLQQKVIGIIMTYNCASLVEGIYRILPPGLYDEVIIVDDGSKDNIAEVAQQLGIPFYPHEHTGYGGNIKFGLKKGVELGGTCMVEIHGDGQFGTQGMLPAVKMMTEEGYDFIMGSRFTDLRQPLRDKMPLIRYLANIGLSFIDRLVLQAPISEYHGGFRVYSKNLVETLDFTNTAQDYLFSFEVIAQACYRKLKIGEVPVRADYSGDHTSINLRKATIYSFQTMAILGEYIWAKLGFATKLFHPTTRSSQL